MHELVLDSVAPEALELIDTNRIVDLGSGVGIPSIPLLAVRPDLFAVLIDERPARLEAAKQWAEAAGVSDRMDTVKGKIQRKLGRITNPQTILLAKALGPPDRVKSLIRPQVRYKALLCYVAGKIENGLPYQIGERTRSIAVMKSFT